MMKKHDEATETVAVTQESIQTGAISEEQNVETAPESQDNYEERLAGLEAELEQAKQAKEEFYNRMLRTQADLENFRRRSRQEMEQLSLYGGEALIKKILPVLDSLERAVGCFNEKTENKSWQEGVDLTLKQFQNILKSEGLEIIPALNAPFDPEVHEAVSQEAGEQVTAPTVVEEMQKGYLYKGKLLRPALVKVAVPQ